MKPTTIIVLSVALVLCVVFVVFQYVARLDGQTPSRQTLWKVDPNDVTTIRITAADGETLAFTRTDGSWRLSEPLNVVADARLVEELCGVFCELDYAESRSGDEAGSDVMGLDHPQWTVELVTDRKSYQLLIGRQVQEVGGQGSITYVRQGGDEDRTVYAVAIDVRRLLQHPPSYFRVKNLFEFQATDIAAVTIEGRNTYRLFRQDGQWRIKAGDFDAPADVERVTKLLSGCAGISAQDFADPSEDAAADLERFGLTDAARQLTITLTVENPAGSGEHTLLFGRPAGELTYARRADSPEVVLVSSDLIDELQPAPESLREHRAVAVAPQEVFQIDLGDLDPPVEMIRSRGVWQMLAPLKRPANGDAVEQLLANLANLPVAAFHDEPVEEQMFGLDRPTATVTLHAAGRDEPVVVRLVQGDEGRSSYIRVGAAGPVFELPADSTQFLLAQAMTYCGTAMEALPDGVAINSLGIHRSDGTFVLQQLDGQWVLANTQQPANVDVVDRIVQRLRHLQAQRIVAMAPNPPPALLQVPDRDRIRVNVVTDSDAATDEGAAFQVVRVDREEFSGVYAWQPTAEPILVGQFDNGLFDDLSADLRGLRIWDITWRDINRFSVQSGGEDPLVLVKEQDRWIIEGEPDTRVEQGAVETFLIGVRRLDALRHVPDSADARRQLGLTSPWLTLSLQTPQHSHRLLISRTGTEETTNRYAAVDGLPDAFVISTDFAGAAAATREQFLEN